MKRAIPLVLFLFLALLGGAARADDVLTVTTPQTAFSYPPSVLFDKVVGESIGITFTWDVTTGAIYNVNLNAQGPVVDFNPVPTQVEYYSPTGGIEDIEWQAPEGYLLQFNSFVIPASGPPSALNAAPGEYEFTDFFMCFSDLPCGPLASGSGIATVTDPIATPEPAEGVMLLGSLVALGLFWRLSRSNAHSFAG